MYLEDFIKSLDVEIREERVCFNCYRVETPNLEFILKGRVIPVSHSGNCKEDAIKTMINFIKGKQYILTNKEGKFIGTVPTDLTLKPIFEPFTLEIEVNSEDELRELWHRFNVSQNKFQSIERVNPPEEYNFITLLGVIEDTIKGLGLYNEIKIIGAQLGV